MRYIQEKAISYDDICLIPQYSDMQSRSEADIRKWEYRNPIANSPMIHTSSPQMMKYLIDNNMMCTIHRYFKCASDQLQYVNGAVGDGQWKVFFSVGKCQIWIQYLIDNGINRFIVDMAHGHSDVCIKTVEFIRKNSPTAIIIAGNVSSKQGYIDLIMAGADAVRAGVASGSICSTHKNTAFGVPIVTNLLECLDAKSAHGGMLIADGGVRTAADVLKAIACGADFVFCGKLLSSTDLGLGPFYTKDKEECDPASTTPYYAQYAGMASHEMRVKNNSHNIKDVSIEGVSGLVKYSGKTDDVIRGIEANLRAGLSYCGARNWYEFFKRVVIREMSVSGIVEKDTHLDA
jgi:IMP dehydrogenase/GMP reductase